MCKRLLKTLFILILTIAIGLSCIACGDAKNQQNESSNTVSENSNQVSTLSSKSEPVTITFSTYNSWVVEIKKGLERYEDSTGNKVNMEVYPDDQFVNLIKTKLATSDVPDVFTLTNNQVTINMSDLEPLDGTWVDNMFDAVRKNATRVSDNKIVNAPYSALSTLGVMYNKEVFKKAGINTPLKTYSDLIAACEAIEKIGIPPVFVANKDGTAFILSNIGGQYIFEKDPSLAQKLMDNEIKPSDSDIFVEMVKRTADIKKYAQKDYLSGGWQDAQKAVLEGNAGMIFDGSWSYGTMKDTYKDMADKVDDLGFMPVTLGDDFLCVTTLAGGGALMVPKAAKNLQASKDFVNFMMQPETLKLIWEVMPGISPYKNVESIMSPWDQEMQDYINQGLPCRDQIFDAYLPGFSIGEYNLVIQNAIAGQDIKKAMDAWYKGYVDLNKAKRTKGF